MGRETGLRMRLRWLPRTTTRMAPRRTKGRMERRRKREKKGRKRETSSSHTLWRKMM